jgi:uncharacterized membrane protein YphA (DoxX/SURF4 family)
MKIELPRGLMGKQRKGPAKLLSFYDRSQHGSKAELLEGSGYDTQRLGQSSFRKPVHFWIRMALGAIFILASIEKILRPAAFAETIHNYQILPDVLINIVAIVLPWIELTIGSLLVAGLLLPGAILSANLLLYVFLCTLVFNTIRGLDVHCGCFTLDLSGTPATLLYIIRDLLFCTMASYLFFKIIMRTDDTPTQAGR